ncbi:MAG: FHA domain-containing protein [Gammaproteobacteria bacterium]|nr:FHA domain-containing protein [Gammaproteobacteria bacterium]MDH5275949.1 FHA domain-containing protein [Gammaproteobacteria bacterium]
MARLILSLDGQVLAEYNMSKERYTVGRLQDNDIRIENPTVSGHHSLIINILNDSFLEDLNSTNGTYVNGRLIKKHALQNGDVVTVGRHQLRFVDVIADEEDEFANTMVIERQAGGVEALAKAEAKSAELNSNGAAPSRPASGEPSTRPLAVAKVQVLNGSFAGREITLNKALTTLGRPGIQVVAITRRADGYHVVQVESTSESQPKLNGQVLGAQARKLADNDVIEIIGIKMGFFLA